MLVRQADQPHQHAHAGDTTLLQHGLGPASGVRADGMSLSQPPCRAAFDPAPLLGNDMAVVGGEASRLTLGVNRDLLQPLVEEPNGVPIPTRPHPAPHILRRGRVVRLGHLDVAVAVDLPLGFLEAGESR